MWNLFVFIIGCAFGSFFNVCIYRIPEKISIIKPRSFCPFCRHTIPWYDNIPILSYIFLKGRCRFCKKRISFIYPLVEIISGLTFAATFIKFGFSIKFFIYSLFLSMVVILAFIDAKKGIIPDGITIPGIILGLGLSPFTISFFSALLGGCIGGFVIFVFILLWKIFFKKEAMGYGDLKLLSMIGIFLGWVSALLVLFIASFVGLIYGLITKKEKLYFGPFLGIGTFVIFFIDHNLFLYYII